MASMQDIRDLKEIFRPGTPVRDKHGETGRVRETQTYIVAFTGPALFVYVDMANGSYAEYSASLLEVVPPLTLGDIPDDETDEAFTAGIDYFPHDTMTEDEAELDRIEAAAEEDHRRWVQGLNPSW